MTLAINWLLGKRKQIGNKNISSNAFKDTLKAFDEFKNKKKSLWSIFFVMERYVYSGSVFDTLYIQRKHNVKKNSSGKINGTKGTFFSFSRAPTHYSFTFDSRFSYELKQKACISKTVRGNSLFRFCFVFIEVYFFSIKCMDSLTLKRHNSFQN